MAHDLKRTNTVVQFTPNPFHDEIRILVRTKTALYDPIHISVVDNLGKPMITIEKQLAGTSTLIECTELASLPPGIYYCIFTIGNDTVIRRIVKL